MVEQAVHFMAVRKQRQRQRKGLRTRHILQRHAPQVTYLLQLTPLLIMLSNYESSSGLIH
jgi:hypothetical protein